MKLYFICIFVFTTSCSLAQDTLPRKYFRYGVGFAAVGTGTTYLCASPFVTFNWYRHKIGIGPLYGQKKYILYSPNAHPPEYQELRELQTTLKGATVFYQYLPKRIGVQMSEKNDPNFNILFEGRIVYALDRFNANSNIYSFAGLIGVGLRQRFLKRVTLSFCLEWGYQVRYGKDAVFDIPGACQEFNEKEVGSGGATLSLEYNFGPKSYVKPAVITNP